MKKHYLQIDIKVQVCYEINAESLEDALEKANDISAYDCIKPNKKCLFDDYEIIGIKGVFS